MACSSGFGSCLCFDNSWTFKVTFRFPGNVNAFALDVPIDLEEAVNVRGVSNFGEENFTLDGFLKEEAGLAIGIQHAGNYFFLNSASEISRKFRPGDVITITRLERTGLEWIEGLRRRADAYPAAPHWNGVPFFVEKVAFRPELEFQLIFPQKENASKIIHAGYSTRTVGANQYPATYDLHATEGELGTQGSKRHKDFNAGFHGPVIVPDDIGPGFAKLILRCPYGPVRWDQVHELYAPSGGILFGEFWSKMDDLKASARNFEGPYGYYFKKDFVYWLHTSGVLIPGMDWWAGQYWSGQTITIEGRVTR